MTEDKHRHIGLTRRELERELAWMLRSVPADPRELVKLLASAVVSLIDKNNAAIVACLAHDDDGKPGAA